MFPLTLGCDGLRDVGSGPRGHCYLCTSVLRAQWGGRALIQAGSIREGSPEEVAPGLRLEEGRVGKGTGIYLLYLQPLQR